MGPSPPTKQDDLRLPTAPTPRPVLPLVPKHYGLWPMCHPRLCACHVWWPLSALLINVSSMKAGALVYSPTYPDPLGQTWALDGCSTNPCRVNGPNIKLVSCYSPAPHQLRLNAGELIRGRETSKASLFTAILKTDQECHTNSVDGTLPSMEVSTKPTLAGAARPALLREDFKPLPAEKGELTCEGDAAEEKTESKGQSPRIGPEERTRARPCQAIGVSPAFWTGASEGSAVTEA